jgi:Arc/MetJ-type ribon-helix-helix transcriptional regulator
MLLEVSQETERIVRQEIASGRFRSADEIIQKGIDARESEFEVERSQRHQEAMERTRDFIANPIRLEGVTIKELIEEGRRL